MDAVKFLFNNRGVNAAQGGYSSQPVFGGPAYFIRNILYNVPSGVAFKFSAKPAGLFVFHNTIIGEQTAGDPSVGTRILRYILRPPSSVRGLAPRGLQ